MNVIPKIFLEKKLRRLSYRMYDFEYAHFEGKKGLRQKYWWIEIIRIDRFGKLSIIGQVN